MSLNRTFLKHVYIIIVYFPQGTPQNSSELLLSPGMPSPYQILDQANKSLSELSYLNNNEGLPSICFTTFPNKVSNKLWSKILNPVRTDLESYCSHYNLDVYN